MSERSSIYGSADELSTDERFMEIRDIFVTVLKRMKAEQNTAETSDNRLGSCEEQSVYATR